VSDGQKAIFVLIDALGWKVLAQRSFLSDWLPFRRPLKTVLGYSSGAIPTILTGLPPSGHGHWNLMRYAPLSSPFRWLKPLALLPSAVTENRLTKKLIKEVGRRYLGMGPQFECSVSPRLLAYFDWVEKRCIYGPGGVSGAPTIFDRLAEHGIPHHVYSYHRGSDQFLLEQARRDLEAGSNGVHFIYLCEFDAFLHEHVQDAQAVTDRLRWYEDQVRDLFECADRRASQTSYAVFSDHGMTPIRRHCDIQAEVERLEFRMPGDYLAVYDSTMARFWFFHEAARSSIVETLQSLDCGRWLRDEELKQLGVWFSDGSYGQAIFLLDPGCLLTNPQARWVPKGMHGFHPEDPHSDACLLTSGQPASSPVSIGDIYEFMCRFAFQEDRNALQENLTA
jgi:hypothetical protein